jgi:putative inorganic carbon (HCO3(-)) transporter
MEELEHEKVIHAPRSQTAGTGFVQNLRQLFIVEKLYNPVGLGVLILITLIVGAGIAYLGLVFGILFLLLLAGIPVTIFIVAYPKFGMIVLVIMAYMLFVILQTGIDFPVGTLMDGLQVLLLLGMLIRMKVEKASWSIFKSPITTVIFIWLGYNLLEVVNPIAVSHLAWLYTIRSVAIVSFCYFVFMYNIRSVKYMRVMFTLWLVLSFLGAAYGFKQEYIGFNSHELQYLNTPGIADLLFIDGHWRKFSFFSDPVAFAYNMVMPSIFCICIIITPIKLWQKIGLIALVLFFLDSMLFSGTRGANVLLPAALLLLAVLKFSKRVLLYISIAAVFLAVLIVMPTSNPNILRFQTAFRPNNDDSYNLRKRNQKRIQPYIQDHMFGGGLGATGVWGQRFAPDSYLAHFPPDSGYMRVAVEDGWIGLLVFCIFMFVILRTGINNYYLIDDPELKTYCLAMTLILFAYNLANFPQEALVQFPSNIMFYLEAALVNVTLRLDRQLKDEKAKTILAAISV